ncbi:hypothetical protein Tco_1063525 [Tanacetum coccineum]
MRGTLLSSSILRIKKSAGKVNLPTSTSKFSAIPTGYWNDLSANLMLILVGLRLLRDNLTYSEYGIRLMLAPRLAKALKEKVLLKLHGIRKLPGSLSLVSLTGFRFGVFGYGVGSSSSSSLSKLIGVSLLIIRVNCFGAFPSYEAKHRLEIRDSVLCLVKAGFLQGSRSKRVGAKNRLIESGSELSCFDSSFVGSSTEFLLPYRDSEWLPLIANSLAVQFQGIVDCGTRSRTCVQHSQQTLNGFIIYCGKKIFKSIKNVTGSG